MCIIAEYREYVKWCKGAGTQPIGFVNWKGIKFNATFNEKTGVWTKNN